MQQAFGQLLSITFLCAACSCARQPGTAEAAPSLQEYPAEGMDELGEAIVPGMSLDRVRELLRCSASELGAFHLGGSGRRTVVFVVPGRGDLLVDVAVTDEVIAPAILVPHRGYERQPDGTLSFIRDDPSLLDGSYLISIP